MINKSDQIYDRHADIDFSEAKPTKPMVDSWQDEQFCITICVDRETLAIFKAHAEISSEDYQILMNEALKQFASNLTEVDFLDETVRQEDA